MASGTYPGDNIADLTTTEARACLMAVAMAKEKGFHEIQVKGDALTVIRKQEQLTQWRTEWRWKDGSIKTHNIGWKGFHAWLKNW